MGKASQMRIAIDKATTNSYLNIIPVKLGCGSWECRCNQFHSIPFKVSGKGGSVTIELAPGPEAYGSLLEKILERFQACRRKGCADKIF